MSKQDNLISVPELHGAKLPRVTSLIKLLEKEAVTKWKIEMTARYFKDKLLDLIKIGFISFEQIQKMDTDEIYQKALNYSDEKAAAAANLGTRTHEAIEKFLRAEDGEEIEIDEDIQKPFNAFMRWWNKAKVDPIILEERVYSLDNGGFVGKIDLAAFLGIGLEKSLYVIDFKTSKAIYDDMVLQIAAYFFAFKQTTKMEPKKAGILLLNKNTGFPEFHIFGITDLGKAYGRFLDLVNYWHRTYD